MKLYQINAPHFCAGFITDQYNRVTQMAPILGWMRGSNLAWIIKLCALKGWTISLVSQWPARPPGRRKQGNADKADWLFSTPLDE